MNFSEFLRQEEEMLLFDEGLMGGAVRAVKGFGGNLVGQTLRGVGNVVTGTAQAVGGVGKVGLGAIQGISGGGLRTAGSTMGSGIKDVATGVGSALKGTAQTAGALSGMTPIMRAAQASKEKRIFQPMSTRRTGVQTAMGMNSWTPEEDAQRDSEEATAAAKTKAAERWRGLIDQYKQTNDQNLKRRIKAEMEKMDKKQYDRIVAGSRAARAQRDRLKWRGVEDQVVDQQRPEDFLGRLAAED